MGNHPTVDYHLRKNNRERRDHGMSVFFDGNTHAESQINVLSDPRAVDGRVGSISMWWNPITFSLQQFLLDFHFPPVLEISQESTGKLTLFGFKPAGGVSFAIGMDDAATLDGTWKHVLYSWDNQAVSPTFHVYLNDVENKGGVTVNDEDTGYANGDYMRIGSTGSDASRFQGRIAELWIDVTTQLDFSVEANRRKFISADGRHVPLGVNGLKPLGLKPYVYSTAYYGGGVAGFLKGRGAMPDLDRDVGGSSDLTPHIGQVIRAKGEL